MCDNILVPAFGTTAGAILFGKNSDRQRNEAQVVELVPGADHGRSEKLRCTYIEIPQAQRTLSALLCRPFWGWGTEMGANEHGVVIGNEGLHAKVPPPSNNALTGMDLVRLALERACSAEEAVQVIVRLLEHHGQGGNCGHLEPAYYNNGFVIADHREGFVVETLEKDWLVERVREPRSLSNKYSIGRNVESISGGLEARIRSEDWRSAGQLDYADVLADPNREHIGNAAARRARSGALLRSFGGQVGVAEMIRILRDHGGERGDGSDWSLDCTTTRTLCMHAGAADRNGQTVGSLVSELHQHDSVHWVTATAVPCISIFKPVLIDVPLPLREPPLTDRFDAETLWWRHEALHRAALSRDFARFVEDVRAERDSLEAEFRARMRAVISGGDGPDRERVVRECWRDAEELEGTWRTRVAALQAQDSSGNEAVAWSTFNELAGMNSEQ